MLIIQTMKNVCYQSRVGHRLLRALAVSLLLSVALHASAALFQYQVFLSGPNESPVNASPGTGFGTVDYNSTAHTLALSLSFSGLTGTTTASHIHAPTPTPFSGTAGVATTTPTFAGFPLGVTSGTYNNVLDLTLASSYNPAFVTANGGTTAGAESALAAAMAAGESYWNVHSTTFPGGEIRGFLVVPEPGSIALLALGACAIGWRSSRRKRA
jgi:hypothetical protein